jgi:hypothetical protein
MRSYFRYFVSRGKKIIKNILTQLSPYDILLNENNYKL